MVNQLMKCEGKGCRVKGGRLVDLTKKRQAKMEENLGGTYCRKCIAGMPIKEGKKYCTLCLECLPIESFRLFKRSDGRMYKRTECKSCQDRATEKAAKCRTSKSRTVYFILQGEEVILIGQANNFCSRLSSYERMCGVRQRTLATTSSISLEWVRAKFSHFKIYDDFYKVVPELVRYIKQVRELNETIECETRVMNEDGWIDDYLSRRPNYFVFRDGQDVLMRTI
jgi:hypothetical protein